MGLWTQVHHPPPPTPALVLGGPESWPLMPFSSVKRKEHRPEKQKTQVLVPVPHSLFVTRHKCFGASVFMHIKWTQ